MMRICERNSRETARDYALRMIIENIISLNLEPGSLMSENELSAEIGLSRTPIREALIELSKAEIVEIIPQRGSRIKLIDYNCVEEARFMRLTLENAIVELACEQITDLDLSRIEENIKLQELCTNPSRLLELDDDFHSELFRLCNKTRTHQMIKSVTIHFDRVRGMSLTVVEGSTIVNDHKNIIQAIRENDPEKARALMTKHLSRYRIDMDAIKQKYPHYIDKTSENI